MVEQQVVVIKVKIHALVEDQELPLRVVKHPLQSCSLNGVSSTLMGERMRL